jgi:hypothetical protein
MTKEQIFILASLKKSTDNFGVSSEERIEKEKIDRIREQYIVDIFRQDTKKFKTKQKRMRLAITLASGILFLLPIQDSMYRGMGICLLPCIWLFNSYLYAQGRFSESTTNRMCFSFPLIMSMWLFFADSGSSWLSYTIPMIICVLIYLMPKNLFTHDLRQSPSTWEKWE